MIETKITNQQVALGCLVTSDWTTLQRIDSRIREKNLEGDLGEEVEMVEAEEDRGGTESVPKKVAMTGERIVVATVTAETTIVVMVTAEMTIVVMVTAEMTIVVMVAAATTIVVMVAAATTIVVMVTAEMMIVAATEDVMRIVVVMAPVGMMTVVATDVEMVVDAVMMTEVAHHGGEMNPKVETLGDVMVAEQGEREGD